MKLANNKREPRCEEIDWKIFNFKQKQNKEIDIYSVFSDEILAEVAENIVKIYDWLFFLVNDEDLRKGYSHLEYPFERNTKGKELSIKDIDFKIVKEDSSCFYEGWYDYEHTITRASDYSVNKNIWLFKHPKDNSSFGCLKERWFTNGHDPAKQSFRSEVEPKINLIFDKIFLKYSFEADFRDGLEDPTYQKNLTIYFFLKDFFEKNN